nr:hypothetical protein CFP56_11925 [Quercus suber]
MPEESAPQLKSRLFRKDRPAQLDEHEMCVRQNGGFDTDKVKKSEKPPPSIPHFWYAESSFVESNRLSSLLGRSNKQSANDKENSEPKTEAQKRRQQVYQAQKRHRDRKAEYVDELEKEVARLRRQGTEAQNEKIAIEKQNDQIKELLAQHSLEARLESTSLASADVLAQKDDGGSLGAGAVLSVRFDPEISQKRTFLDFEMDDVVQTATDTSTSEASVEPRRKSDNKSPVKGDTAAALDFILALEWPCERHSAHEGLQVDSGGCVVQELDLHHHALSTTNAVFQSALPIGQHHAQQPPAGTLETDLTQQTGQQKWYLPHSEIDKLVKLSERLPLGDEQLTPAQAYSAIRETVPSDEWLRPALDALKVPLCGLTRCGGFGTVLPADEFWQMLDNTIETLKSTRPDLP